MELKSLFLGILFSVGIFGIKAGAGLHYCLIRENRSGMRWIVRSGFAILYGILFIGITVGLRDLDILSHFDSIQKFLAGGMLVHFVLACLMLVWGVVLLKSRDDGMAGNKSLGWMALVLPCPVCMTVIGISVAFIISAFPNAATRSVLVLYLAFVTLSFLTSAVMGKFEKGFIRSPERLLGTAMTMVSAYFLLSIVIMPQFSGLDEVYRLAADSGGDPQSAEKSIWPAIGMSLALFGIGYLYMRRHIQTTVLSRHRGKRTRFWQGAIHD